MLDLDFDRRSGDRLSIRRACKVYDPRSRKYFAGWTCNISPGGALLRVDRSVPFEPGDSVYVGIMQRRRHALLRSRDMMEGQVIRVLDVPGGETVFAVHYAGAFDSESSIRRAA